MDETENRVQVTGGLDQHNFEWISHLILTFSTKNFHKNRIFDWTYEK